MKATLPGSHAGATALILILALAPGLAVSAPVPGGPAAASAAQAQRRGHSAAARAGRPPKARVVQVGAGTTSKETTQFSGPKTPPRGNGTPPPPGASACKDFHGAERHACLQTVLRGPGAAGSRSAKGQGGKRR